MSVARPSILTPQIEWIPAELRQDTQWVAWRLVFRGDKWTKLPINPRTGHNAACDDPATWATFDEAVSYWRRGRADGIGFVFAESDPFAGIDLDKCIEASGIAPWASAILATLNSYAEISPSGTGIKIIVRASLPPGRRRKGRIEMYDRLRFFTITGHRVDNTPATIADRQTELAALHAELFPPEPARKQTTGGGLLNADDDQLIEKAKTAANGARFAQLWSGDTTGYTSASEADLALCSLIAFWVGPDSERIDRLFRASGLAREKWTERQDYRERTISAALQRSDFYKPPAPKRQSASPVLPPLTHYRRRRHHAPNAAKYGLKPAIMYVGGYL